MFAILFWKSPELKDKDCGVMKFLADMPPCLGGEEPRINVA